MAGNVKEWVWNEGREGARFIPGGAWGSACVLLAAALAGAAWIALAGALRQWRGVNETISSLLLGYIAIAVFKHLVEGPMRA